MADFSFDLNALNDLQAAGKTLLKEQEEANAARSARDSEVMRLAAEKVKLAKGAQEVAKNTAESASQHLDQMDANLSRVNEIQDSWMLRAVDGLATGFGIKNYSTKLLMKDTAIEEAALQTSMTRNELAAQGLKAKSDEINAKAAAADAKLLLETGDVEDLAAQMGILKSLRLDSEEIKEYSIAQSTDEQLGLLAKNGVISEQRYKEEVQVRSSKALSLQSQKNAAVLQSYQLQEAKITSLSDDALRDPNQTKGLPAQFVKDELRRRSIESMAWDQQRMSTAATARAEAAATLDADQLKAAGAAGERGMTPFAANQTIEERKAQEAINKNRTATAEMNAAANAARAAELMLESSTIQMQEDALKAGGDTGLAIFKNKDGTEIKVPASKVAAHMKLQKDVQVNNALVQAGGLVAESTIDTTMSQVERMLGVDSEESRNATVQDRMNSILGRQDIDPDTRMGLEIIQGKYKAAKGGKLPADATNQMLTESLELISKTRQTMMKKRLEGTGAANRPGMQEYIERGSISSIEKSVPIAATVAVVDEPTNNILYDGATAALRGSMATTAMTSQAENSKDLLAQLSAKDYTPAELAAMNATKPDIQAQMASGIVAGVVTDAHVQTLAAMGLKDTARMISQGQFFTNNVLDERQIISSLQKQNINVSEYMEKLREASKISARKLMTPTGENGHIIAAYNKLLFNNQNEVYAENYSMARMQDAIKGDQQTQKYNQSLVDAISQFGL